MNQLEKNIFSSFFQILCLFATFWVMIDSKYLTRHTRFSLANSRYYSPFSRFFALVLALPPTFRFTLQSFVKYVFTCLILFLFLI